MGFKVIETEEEFFAALAAGLLWINIDTGKPRAAGKWYRPKDVGYTSDASVISCWKSSASDNYGYIKEDFAVLVEDDGEGDSPTTAREE